MKQRKQILIMYARNIALFINEYINANKWLQHTQRIEENIDIAQSIYCIPKRLFSVKGNRIRDSDFILES